MTSSTIILRSFLKEISSVTLPLPVPSPDEKRGGFMRRVAPCHGKKEIKELAEKKRKAHIEYLSQKTDEHRSQ